MIDALKRHQAETAASPGRPPAVLEQAFSGRAVDVSFTFSNILIAGALILFMNHSGMKIYTKRLDIFLMSEDTSIVISVEDIKNI